MEDPTDAERFADLAVATWAGVFEALTPIIGLGGTAALFQRSMLLRIGEYPWLAAALENAVTGEFTSLRLAFSLQEKTAVAAANSAMLQSVLQLLGNLIGESLTQRLLQAVCERHHRITQDGST